jgi:hypothetical protein
MTHQRAATLFAAGAAAFLAALLVTGAALTAVQSSSSIDLVAIDVVSQGNTATSLGKIDSCTRTEIGSSVPVDVVINRIPADKTMVGFEFHLTYDPKVVEVTAVDNALLLAAGGNYTPFEAPGSLGDTVPDSDGEFIVSAADLGGNNESGAGVLSRITLKARAAGVSTLTLGDSPGSFTNIIDGDTNESIQIDHQGVAAVAVGQACQSNPPEPVVTTLPPLEELFKTPVGSTPPPGTPSTPGPGGDGSPTADSTAAPATPDPRTPGAIETATAVATSSTPGVNDGDGDFPVVWVIVGAVLGLGAAGGAGYVLYRRRSGG